MPPRRRPALLLLLLAVALAPARGAADLPPGPRHVVLILTDDQRFDTLWAMPILQQKLADRGVVFENAVMTTPLCCPARASLLSGGWLAQNTGVLTNNPPSGGFPRFVDEDSLPLRLQRAGYRTMMIGKLMNDWQAPHVPRGWTEFAASSSTKFLVGSSGEQPGTGQYVLHSSYQTDAERDRVLAFIDRELPSGAPLFIWFSSHHPHYPAVPPPQDEDLFPGFVWRGRGYEPGHWMEPFLSSVEEQDEFHRDQLRCLQVVDRALGAIVDRLEQAGELERTLFVFTSDNGFLWGEHGDFGKKSPWEESIRVPLVVRAPGVAPRSEAKLVAVNLDLAATFLDWAGLPVTGDGASLLPLLEDPGAPWREELLIEHWDRTWAGFRTRDAAGQEWKYFERVEGTRHLFDLSADPYELVDLAGDPAQQARVADFAARLAPRKAIATTYYKATAYADFGKPFGLSLGVWGGTPPFAWRLASGTLPLGVAFDASTGTFSGMPLAVGSSSLQYELTGSRVLPQAGRPESFLDTLALTVLAGDVDLDGVRDDADNCPFHANAGQADADGDGIGDACTACSDGIDNDRDGRVDFDGAASVNGGAAVVPRDPQCADASGRRETVRSCGLGFELAPAIALLFASRARRTAAARRVG
jgi:arylsulfatase A-like enzyme